MTKAQDNKKISSDYETPVIKIFRFTTENILMASEMGEPTSGESGKNPDSVSDWLFN